MEARISKVIARHRTALPQLPLKLGAICPPLQGQGLPVQWSHRPLRRSRKTRRTARASTEYHLNPWYSSFTPKKIATTTKQPQSEGASPTLSPLLSFCAMKGSSLDNVAQIARQVQADSTHLDSFAPHANLPLNVFAAVPITPIPATRTSTIVAATLAAADPIIRLARELPAAQNLPSEDTRRWPLCTVQVARVLLISELPRLNQRLVDCCLPT